jgi:hypothetical protein
MAVQAMSCRVGVITTVAMGTMLDGSLMLAARSVSPATPIPAETRVSARRFPLLPLARWTPSEIPSDSPTVAPRKASPAPQSDLVKLLLIFSLFWTVNHKKLKRQKNEGQKNVL